MELDYCNVHYRTHAFDDPDAGCVGLELLSNTKGETASLGKITFWDGAGQFFIEMTGSEVPLEIIEKFITEAKQAIQTG